MKAVNFVATAQTPEVAEFEIINRVVQLIREGMRLDENHVVAYNQMIPIPPDEGIFVAVGLLDTKPWASSLSYKDVSTTTVNGAGATIYTPALNEVQTSNSRDVLSIHMMSRDNSARRRRKELQFALTGTLAAQMQEAYGFLIGRIPVGFADSSQTEGAERLNRFTMTVAVLSAAEREGPVEFFDSFAGSPQVTTQP